MKYEPKKNSKAPEIISFSLFALAAVLTLAANFARGAYLSVVQLAVIILLCAFIYILVRFRFTSFMYEVRAKSKAEEAQIDELGQSELLFIVSRKQSKKGYAAEFACMLDEIISVEKVEDNSAENGKKRYIYYRNMKPRAKYRLTVEGDNETLFVFLEIDGDGTELIKILENKKENI